MVSRDEVIAVYRQLLGRVPDAAEIETQLANAGDLEHLLRAVHESSEYEMRRHRLEPETNSAEPHPNVWSAELDRFYPAPGTRTPGDIAEVGRNGALFLYEGANQLRQQFRGTYQLPQGWEAGWRRVADARAAGAQRLGCRLLWLAIPDKVAVAPHLLVDPPARVQTPIRRLIDELHVPFHYPLAELEATVDGGYLKADSHLSLEGNRTVAEIVVRELSAPALPAITDVEPEDRLVVGDLGRQFEPPLAEVRQIARAFPGTMRESTWDVFTAAGGHRGGRHVFVNPDARDRRRVAICGDSYGAGLGAEQGLAWWLTWVLREVHFVWLPFGWDERYLASAKPDVVVLQGAERFCVRVPELDTDLRQLEAEARC